MASQRTFFRPHRGYQNSTHTQLGRYASETLGHGSMETAFRCPEGVDENDWLAAMMVDIYNNVSHLYGTMTEFCLPNKDSCRTMNAGPKYEYLWADHDRVRKPIQCSAIEYANYLFDWIDDQMTDPKIFPTDPAASYPSHFKMIIKTMCKKLFRIYAHMYNRHHEHIELLELYPYINSAFKGFLYFCETFDLIDSREVAPLRDHIRSNLGRAYKQPFLRSNSSSPHGRPRIQYAKQRDFVHSNGVERNGRSTPTAQSPLGDVSTPMSVIYHPDEESISVSQSPSSHQLAVISEPTETEFDERQGGLSPTTTVCVHTSGSIDRPPSLGRHSSTGTTTTTSSSTSSNGGPTPDEIKQRWVRLKKKFLDDDVCDEPKESPSRSGNYESEKKEPSSSSSSPPQLKPKQAPPTLPPPLHNGDIAQEPVEEPRRIVSPRQQIADFQAEQHSRKTAEELASQIRKNKELQKQNDELQDRLFKTEKELKKMRDELEAARREIERLKNAAEEVEEESASPAIPAAEPIPPPFEPPSPIPVSLVTPSPTTPPEDHRRPPTTRFVQPNHQSRLSPTTLPPPPPPPPLPHDGFHRQSVSPRRMKLGGYARTPDASDAMRQQQYGPMKRTDFRSERWMTKPRQPHGPPSTSSTPRISRNRANSNPKQFIIRRKHTDKPAPQKALPKLPKS